jgi:hypothetical protein
MLRPHVRIFKGNPSLPITATQGGSNNRRYDDDETCDVPYLDQGDDLGRGSQTGLD